MTFVLLLPVGFIAEQPQNAQNIQAFWAKFKAAVAKDDKEAVASMTKLPFLFESKERSKEEFIKTVYDQLLDRRVKRCFATAKLVKEGDVYEVFCGKHIFYFGLVEGAYKFTEFAVDY
jgi:hypothetical protein